MKKMILSLLFVSFVFNVFAFENEIHPDSLIRLIESTDEETKKVEVYLELCDYYVDHNKDSLKIICEKVLPIIEDNLSLAKKIKYSTWVKLKADALLHFGHWHSNAGHSSIAMDYYHNSLTLYQSINNINGAGNAYNFLGLTLYQQGQYQGAKKYFFQSMINFRKSNDQLGMGRSLNNIGAIYDALIKPDSAIYFYSKSLKIRKQIKDYSGMAMTITNMGEIYSENGEKTKSLNCFIEGLNYARKANMMTTLTYAYYSVSASYYDSQNYLLALKYADSSMLVAQKIKSQDDIKYAAQLLDKIYIKLGNWKNARNFFELFIATRDTLDNLKNREAVIHKEAEFKSLRQKDLLEKQTELAREGEKRQSLISYLITVGATAIILLLTIILMRIKISKDKKMAQQNNTIRKQNEDSKLLSEIGQHISSTLNLENIFEEIHMNVSKLMDAEIFGIRIYHKEKEKIEYKFEMESGQRDPIEFIDLNDKNNYTVWSISNKKSIFINDNLKEYNKYVSEIKVPSGKLPESIMFHPMIVEEEVIGVITVQSFQKNAYTDYQFNLLKALASYAGSALHNAILYESLEKKVEERTEELSIKNKDITDSINYARHIQSAVQPPSSELQTYLKDGFVFSLPKDIVSGDFYWLEVVGNSIYFAVADCTGHGVPGAMVSLICSNALSRAVHAFGLTQPASILNKTRELVINAFERGEAEVNDGMDIALCKLIYNKNDIDLEFSGAHNGLIIIQDKNEIILKGDKQPVGIYPYEKPFTNHQLKLKNGDSLYLYSDGFIDQFGGENKKKYSMRKFRDLINRIQNFSMNEQRKIFESEFNNWKGESPQIDDVSVVGIKIVN